MGGEGGWARGLGEQEAGSESIGLPPQAVRGSVGLSGCAVHACHGKRTVSPVHEGGGDLVKNKMETKRTLLLRRSFYILIQVCSQSSFS